MPSNHLAAIRNNLLRWYDRARRDLPWRRTRDPYAIWIAETMLQQTQVTTVVPYYERFLTTFPTVQTLARAPLRKVLALWSGLGYYRRAEHLKKSAREIVGKYAGRLPQDYRELLSLPGIGDYTAGALMSIAFDKPYPALDGNARRVLSRIFSAHNETELRHHAVALVPKSRPGYFNQGLMELGATICLPQAPRCDACPVARHCSAQSMRRQNLSSLLRGERVKAPLRTRDVVWPLAIVRNDGKILLRRRSTNGMLAGLWELPGGETRKRDSLQATLRRHLIDLNTRLGLPRRVGEIRHSITHRRIRSPIFVFDNPRAGDVSLRRYSHWRWLTSSSIRRYPVSSMTIKALKLLATDEANLS